MGTLYFTSSLASTHKGPDFIPFIDPETGPQTVFAQRIFDLLVDLDNEFWILLRRASSGEWTVEEVKKIFDCGTTLYGARHPLDDRSL